MSSIPPAPSAARGATFAVVILTAMNLLNYVDRWVPSAVKELFKADLHLSDTETSLPITSFVVVYMIASPIFGALADKYRRNVLIAAGVALWSLATVGAGLVSGFWSFLVARALVGIGEAAYATLAPSVLSDFYPPSRRNRILTIFYVAIPVGSALGFIAGGQLGVRFGWRAAFMLCGLPGLIASLFALFMREPQRGTFDPPSPSLPGWPAALRALQRNREFVTTVAGYTAVTFASGALADWFPAFLVRHRGFAIDQAGSIIGASSVIGGLAGTAAGGFLGDWLQGRFRKPYLALSALSMAGATLCIVVALLVRDHTWIFALMLIAQFLFWFYNGPVNTILVNCVAADLRARAFSISILAIHLLGDAISPSLVGYASDTIGLTRAIAIVPVATLAGAAIWTWGWKSLPEGSPAVAAS